MEVFGDTLCIWLHSINISYMEFNMTGISLGIFLGIFLSTCLREESESLHGNSHSESRQGCMTEAWNCTALVQKDMSPAPGNLEDMDSRSQWTQKIT